MSTLTDVFMPEDLCARCAEKVPKKNLKVFAETSPSSTFSSSNLFFCSKKCLEQFVRGWTAAKELDSGD